ncbi:MAG TPA: glycoside hydrolase family 97 protein [Bacteroidales bacterium]|nr:glycoside hydrolase family 97 protein [Bacteroidales bacterium]HQJ81510.1 glycoside hydrolase family 97 protein [Bacteroidales bacterium]
MKQLFVFLFVLAGINAHPAPAVYKISSPDGKIAVELSAGPDIRWSATYQNSEIISSVKAGLVSGDGRLSGENESVRRAQYGKIDDVLEPVVAHRHSRIEDKCNTLRISFRSGLALDFRVYNDGIAYRFETALKGELIVRDEISELKFPSGSFSYYPLEERFMSHNERKYIYSSLDTLTDIHLASLPVLFTTKGINILLTEADIQDYPGMWLRGMGSGGLRAVWPPCPETEELRGDRDVFVTGARDYIASTAGSRTFPWRAFVIAENDGRLIESELVYKLAAPLRLKDTGWIKPGKVAWDWWNANNIYGVDFRAGINTETYRYYIDFAAANGIEYIIIDDGWYPLGETVLKSVPGMDVPELCRYAAERNVGVILWVAWNLFWDEIDEAVALYEKWGVKGVKVDFMQRDDQKIVNFYHEAARKTAEHRLLINFHGSYKPDGMIRTWPNALTREGVMGLENNKWSSDITPSHELTIPFIRMVAGPMDFTPGAMINMGQSEFHPLFNRPSSQGTRAHQMALYVLYESPMQMLCDSPVNYMREQECTDFIVKIPVVWDDLLVLDAKITEYLLLARRSGNDWFAGAITDWTARDLELDLSFLPEGEYRMEIFCDGINADRHAQDYRHLTKTVRQGEKLKINLVSGGGWLAKISPIK